MSETLEREDPLLTIREAAAMLSVSKQTLRKFSKERGLPPPLQLSPQTLRYRRSTLTRFLDEQEANAGAAQQARTVVKRKPAERVRISRRR